MEINQKNAIRLWSVQFGGGNEAVDYSGRKIVKSAYNDRNSKYGWNIDHILPKSRKGKNEEKNLICCHIATNDEKKDSFPVFNANGKSFQIVNKNSSWVIEHLRKQNNVDKNFALNVWKNIFGDAEQEEDFAGRIIYKSHYKKLNSNYAWDIAQAVEVKPLDYDNIVLANTETLEEKDGKTAFISNDKKFVVKKHKGGYRILRTDAIENAFEPLNLQQFFTSININSIVFSSYIFVKVGACSHQNFSSLIVTLKEILSSFDAEFAVETIKSENLIVFKTLTPTKAETEEVANAAIVVNTYKPRLLKQFDLKNFTIVNALFEEYKFAYELEIYEARNYNKDIATVLSALTKYQWIESSLYINQLVASNIKNKPKTEYSWTFGLTERNLIYTELDKKLNG